MNRRPRLHSSLIDEPSAKVGGKSAGQTVGPRQTYLGARAIAILATVRHIYRQGPSRGHQCGRRGEHPLANIEAAHPLWRSYAAFGLRIASQIALPELADAEGDEAAPDLVIAMGPVARSLAGARHVEPPVQIDGETFLLDLPPARYLVENGRRITIDPAPGAAEGDIRVWLLGSVMGVVCHQRGLLPLHANAIQIGAAAAAFAGPSGAGKSTLAAWFQERGRSVLCDDVCVISFGADGEPMAWAGVPRIKLWRDALAALGRTPDGLDRVALHHEKYNLPIRHAGSPRPLRLARLYVLRQTATTPDRMVNRLSGAAAVGAIADNTYRWPLAVKMKRSPKLLANCVALAKHCQVFTVDRRWGYGDFEAEACKIERHLLEGM
jgi:hypothetical protein